MINFVLYVIALFITTAWTGFVAWVLWGWHLIPIGILPQLTIYETIGVLVSIRIAILKVDSEYVPTDEFAEKLLITFVQSMIAPVILLCIGWIVL